MNDPQASYMFCLALIATKVSPFFTVGASLFSSSMKVIGLAGVTNQAPGSMRRLNAIPGQVASPRDPLPGCAFAPRCALAMPECSAAMPPLADLAAGRRSRCLRWSLL